MAVPGRVLFLDMNSFYASVEQQERPELRSKPTIVVPFVVDSTCAIAASYEAKALGIKTGTSVRRARKLCPSIEIVEARPGLYLEYHAGIVEALRSHFVCVKVLSVDEMACRMGPLYATREQEIALARRVKRHICAWLGEGIRCSVGIAPNVFLAKVAADMQKPDGLTVLDRENLPSALFALDLLDLPGIGPRIAVRLRHHNIATVQALWEASVIDLRRAWGSVVGERWWYMLRGSHTADYGAYIPEVRKSVGHSHVLPPELRKQAGARDTMLRLTSRALKRLRAYGQAAGAVQVMIEYRHVEDFSPSYWRKRSSKHIHSSDDRFWLKVVRRLLESMPPPRHRYRPHWVGLVFSDLIACRDTNLSLFEDPIQQVQAMEAMDAINAKFGHVIDLAGVFWQRDRAPFRIAYGAPDISRS